MKDNKDPLDELVKDTSKMIESDLALTPIELIGIMACAKYLLVQWYAKETKQHFSPQHQQKVKDGDLVRAYVILNLNDFIIASEHDKQELSIQGRAFIETHYGGQTVYGVKIAERK